MAETKEREVQTIQLAGSVGLSLAEKLASVTISFVILWILSAENYGFVNVIENAVSTIIIFVNLGLTGAISHLVANSIEKDPEMNPVAYLIASMTFMIFASAIISLLTPIILSLLGLSDYWTIEYVFCFIGTLLLLISLLAQTFLAGIHEYSKSLYSRTMKPIVNALVIPFSFLLSTYGYFLATFLIGITFLFINIILVVKALRNKDISLTVNTKDFKSSMKGLKSYSPKIFFSKIMRQIYFTAPVLILARSSNEAVAFFSVAFLLTGLITLFPTSLTRYFLPTITGFLARKEYDRVENYYRNGIGFTIAAIIPINMTLLLFPEAVLWLLKPSYMASIPHMIPLAIASIFYCMWIFDSVLFYAANKVQFSVLAELIIACISISSSLLFLPIFGEAFISWGLMLGLVGGWLVQQFFMKKHIGVSIGSNLILKASLLSFAIIVVERITSTIVYFAGFNESVFLSILIAGITFLISVGVTFALSLVPRDRIYNFLRLILGRKKKEATHQVTIGRA